MFSKLVEAMEDMINALAQCFTDIANEIVRIFKKLGDFRNHSQKCEQNVCQGDCVHCRALDSNESLYGDSLAGYYHENCGALIPRQRGFVCKSCGSSFTAGVDVSRNS